MKNLVKVFFAAFVLVAVSSGAFAQTSDNDKVGVSATVVTNLNVIKGNDVSFGNVVVGTNPEIVLGGTNVGIIGNATPGTFTIEGNAGSSIAVTFSSSDLSTLEEGATVSTIKFLPSVKVNSTSTIDGSSAIVTTGSNLLTAGKSYFFVGGKLTAADGEAVLPAGTSGFTYTGDFTLNATYN